MCMIIAVFCPIYHLQMLRISVSGINERDKSDAQTVQKGEESLKEEAAQVATNLKPPVIHTIVPNCRSQIMTSDPSSTRLHPDIM